MAENTELDASALTATDANQQQDFASLMSSNNQATNNVETSSDGPAGDPLGDAMRYSQYVGRQQLQNKIDPPTSLIDSMTYQKSPGIRYLDADSIAPVKQIWCSIQRKLCWLW
jgi:hypothetical protein